MAKLVTVGTFTGPIEAHLAKGRLEAEGIPALVAHEHHIWANWGFSQALGGVKVQVSEENAAKAGDVMVAHTTGQFESALEDEFHNLESRACPACGSIKFKSRLPLGLVILAIATLGFGAAIFPVRRERHVCRDCGKKWRH